MVHAADGFDRGVAELNRLFQKDTAKAETNGRRWGGVILQVINFPNSST